jgi:hypothetical protein
LGNAAVFFLAQLTHERKGAPMLNTKTTLIALFSAAVLAACGGGGDGTDTDARIKYLGTWASGCDLETTNSYSKSSITMRTQGAANLLGDYSEQYFDDSNCTVPKTGADASDSWTNTYTFEGTKTLADGKVVDTVRITLPDDEYAGQTFPYILYTADNKLWGELNDPDIPDVDEDVDAAGFPTALTPSRYLTRISN